MRKISIGYSALRTRDSAPPSQQNTAWLPSGRATTAAALAALLLVGGGAAAYGYCPAPGPTEQDIIHQAVDMVHQGRSGYNTQVPLEDSSLEAELMLRMVRFVKASGVANWRWIVEAAAETLEDEHVAAAGAEFRRLAKEHPEVLEAAAAFDFVACNIEDVIRDGGATDARFLLDLSADLVSEMRLPDDLLGRMIQDRRLTAATIRTFGQDAVVDLLLKLQDTVQDVFPGIAEDEDGA